MRSPAHFIAAIALALPSVSRLSAQTSGLRFAISFPKSIHAEPITGRALLIISRDSNPEPRYQNHALDRGLPTFGRDVNALAAGSQVIIDATVPGHPLTSLNDLPAGDYYAQAVLNVYTEFHRADGHTIWAHMDQWEGQNFVVSPGTPGVFGQHELTPCKRCISLWAAREGTWLATHHRGQHRSRNGRLHHGACAAG